MKAFDPFNERFVACEEVRVMYNPLGSTAICCNLATGKEKSPW
jgi:hypothetical protein